MSQATLPEYKEYQTQVVKNAKAMCDALLKKDYLVVSGTYCVPQNHKWSI